MNLEIMPQVNKCLFGWTEISGSTDTQYLIKTGCAEAKHILQLPRKNKDNHELFHFILFQICFGKENLLTVQGDLKKLNEYEKGGLWCFW